MAIRGLQSIRENFLQTLYGPRACTLTKIELHDIVHVCFSRNFVRSHYWYSDVASGVFCRRRRLSVTFALSRTHRLATMHY